MGGQKVGYFCPCKRSTQIKGESKCFKPSQKRIQINTELSYPDQAIERCHNEEPEFFVALIHLAYIY